MTQASSPTPVPPAPPTHGKAPSDPNLPGSDKANNRERLIAKFIQKSRAISLLYLIMLPTILSMTIIGYYPKLDVIIKSFYRWTPGQVLEFVGLANFIEAFADPLFWQSFKVVAIMLLANLIKMWPGIIVAIALHRLISNRWRYIYQVAFVVPMVVPQLVWLLIWKSFFDPDFGLVNRFLQLTGFMDVLAWLDGTREDPGVMPQFAGILQNIAAHTLEPALGNVWLLIALGGALMAKAARAKWVMWAGITLFAIWAGSSQPWFRTVIVFALAVGGGEILLRQFGKQTGKDIANRIGLGCMVVGILYVLLAMIWAHPTGQFRGGSPAWLGNQDLVLPALIMWGFPWVGTVGVLIYLAGLQQISEDVYEAAELDGVGPIAKLFKIELPLIMTQVRINLIFMTIATLTGYEFYLILLGPEGGPGNVGIVPGLYMYRKSFIESQYGYACALGMIMFVMILILTIIYQKYVKVDK